MFVVDICFQQFKQWIYVTSAAYKENPALVDSTNPYSELYLNLSVLMLLLTLFYVIA
jgi:hypothetical protein